MFLLFSSLFGFQFVFKPRTTPLRQSVLHEKATKLTSQSVGSPKVLEIFANCQNNWPGFSARPAHNRDNLILRSLRSRWERQNEKLNVRESYPRK